MGCGTHCSGANRHHWSDRPLQCASCQTSKQESDSIQGELISELLGS